MKSMQLRAFNQFFFQFLDQCIASFPSNNNIPAAKVSAEMIKRANPTAILKAWYSGIAIPYRRPIFENNADFFAEKDYQADILIFPYADRILEIIEEIRRSIPLVTDDERRILFHHLQTLCFMSEEYMSAFGPP
jgi:hypothetical protein